MQKSRGCGDYLVQSLWGQRGFNARIFEECEAWRAAVGETPSRFAERVGVHASTYLRWIDAGEIAGGISAVDMWQLLDALVQRRWEFAREFLTHEKPRRRFVGPHEVKPLQGRYACPICGYAVLDVHFGGRTWDHLPQGWLRREGGGVSMCPLIDRRGIEGQTVSTDTGRHLELSNDHDLLELPRVIEEVKRETNNA